MLGKETIVNKKEKSLQVQAHEAMHKIPGMPEHGEASRLNSHKGNLHRPLQNRPFKNQLLQGVRINHPGREPKVLISWQKKVARFFGVEMK